MNFSAGCCILNRSNAGVMELVDVVDSKSTASDGVPVRVRSPAPLRNDLCMSGSRAGRARLDTKGLSSFKPVTASLGHGCVLPNWQLSYSVHMTHVGAKSALLRRLFILTDKKTPSARSLAPPLKIVTADAGSRFCFWVGRPPIYLFSLHSSLKTDRPILGSNK